MFDTLDRARMAMNGQRLLLTVVSDDAGRVLAASDPLRALIDSAMTEFVAGAGSMDTVSALGSEPVVRVLGPLEYQGRIIGQVLTELDVPEFVDPLRGGIRLCLHGRTTRRSILRSLGQGASASL